MPSVADFRLTLYEIADRLEAEIAPWVFPKEVLNELDDMSDRAGLLRADAPWSGLPHALAAMEITKELRKLASDLEGVPEPPKGGNDA